jgi:DNA-binding transcriptional LysR family regulator
MSRATLRRYFRHGLFPQLMVFEAVARLGSVTRAAQELHFAQPTVSMQLKKLSHHLELRLFEQHGRRLRLTPAGEALREVCGEMLELFERAEERLAGFRQKKSESVLLAAVAEARPVAARLLAERDILLGRLAAFAREALMLDAYNSVDEPREQEPWKSHASTTRR